MHGMLAGMHGDTWHALMTGWGMDDNVYAGDGAVRGGGG
jgi:hypothetical protein